MKATHKGLVRIHRCQKTRHRLRGGKLPVSQDKQEALDLTQRLLDHVTTADIMEALYFKQQVDKGLDDPGSDSDACGVER